MSERYRRLRFPVRTEDVDQYPAYRVDPAPWKALGPVLTKAFERVFFGGKARVILLQGPMGTGKTALCRMLWEQAQKPIAPAHETGPASFELEDEFFDAHPPAGTLDDNSDDFNIFNINTMGKTEEESLWKTLCGRFSVQLHWAKHESEWLAKAKAFTAGCPDIPLIVIDDAHAEMILAGLCGVDLSALKQSRSKKAREAALFSQAAQGIGGLCQAEFSRAVLLLCSHRSDLFDRIEREIFSPGLCETVQIPHPSSLERETIVRTNLNRMNALSYWYSLDISAQPERRRVWDMFHENAGYSQCYLAVDDALRSAPRMGRPANRNVITMVAVGLSPAKARYFLELHGIVASDDYIGEHLSVSYIRGGWASHLLPNALIEDKTQGERRRKAMLVQSEFGMRLVALDHKGAYALLRPPAALDMGERLLEAIEFFPSGSHVLKQHKQVYETLSAELIAAEFPGPAFQAFREDFFGMGERAGIQKKLDEAMAQRIGPYRKGFARYPSLKPALVVNEYSPCTISQAPSNGHGDLTAALKRSSHSVEFFMVADGHETELAQEIVSRIEPYADMLASV